MRSANFVFLFLGTLLFCIFAAMAAKEDVAVKSAPQLRDSTLNINSAFTNASDSTDILDSTQASITQPDSIDYEATDIVYDIKRRIIHLNDRAVVRYHGMTLIADTIIFHQEKDILEAIGLPQLIDGSDTTTGETMVYNIRTRRGRVTYASATNSGSHYDGNLIVRSADNALYMREGSFAACARIDTPQTSFYGKDIKVMPGNKTIVRPVVMNLADVPVAVLPYFIFPLDRSRTTGILTPAFGGQPQNGGYLDNLGLYLAPNDYMDFTASTRIYEFREVLIRLSSQYTMQYWFNGSISGQWAQTGDFKNRNSQWSLDYNHNQTITPDNLLTLSGRGSLVSSKQFYTKYSRDTTLLINQTATANLSLSKRFPAINASSAISWNRTQNLRTNYITEELPSFSFNLPSRPLIPQKKSSEDEKNEPVWFNNIYYNYGIRGLMRHEAFDSLPDVFRSGITQSIDISAPQTIFKYFTINPSFRTRLSTFDAYIDTSAVDTFFSYDTLFDSTRQITKIDTTRKAIFDTTYAFRADPDFRFADANDVSWSTGVSLSTHLYGTFPIRIFNFAGLRHTLTPSVSYSFTPAHEQPHSFVRIVDYATGQKKQSQIINFNLGNQFDGKVIKPPLREGDEPKEEKFTILTASLSTSYNREAEKRRWSDLSLNAGTSFQRLGVNFSSSFWLYDEQDQLSAPTLSNYSVNFSVGTLGASGSLWDGDFIDRNGFLPRNRLSDYLNAGQQQWSVSLSPSYSFSASKQHRNDPFVINREYHLGANASINFTRRWSVRWGSTYNFATNQFIGNNCNFYCDLECWDLSFDWNPGGINSGSYYFLVKLKKIPDIKWDKRS